MFTSYKFVLKSGSSDTGKDTEKPGIDVSKRGLMMGIIFGRSIFFFIATALFFLLYLGGLYSKPMYSL